MVDAALAKSPSCDVAEVKKEVGPGLVRKIVVDVSQFQSQVLTSQNILRHTPPRDT